MLAAFHKNQINSFRNEQEVGSISAFDFSLETSNLGLLFHFMLLLSLESTSRFRVSRLSYRSIINSASSIEPDWTADASSRGMSCTKQW